MQILLFPMFIDASSLVLLGMVRSLINNMHFQVQTPQIILGVGWARELSRPIIKLWVAKIVISVLEGGA